MPERAREFATDVVRRLRAAGYQALWAGGCVRDLLLGKVPKDYDVATSARPEQVREVFGRRRTFAIGASFGVILVRGPSPSMDVEVATFRTEGPYLDGRRPEQVSFATAEEDARRRDFTINGMFFDPVTDQVLDYVQGQHDLAARTIRAIGVPAARMEEDRLRLLRAVRFCTTLDFELEAETATAVRGMAAGIHLVSAERITQEMKRLLTDPHRARGVTLCEELHLLPEILPELTAAGVVPPQQKPDSRTAEDSPWLRTLNRMALLQGPGFELAFATLLLEVGQEPGQSTGEGSTDLCGVGNARAICRRWKLSNDETGHITWLLARRHLLHRGMELPLSVLKPLAVAPAFHDLVELTRVDRLTRGLDLSPLLAVDDYVQSTPLEILDPPPLLNGGDLIAAGYRPGKQFSSWLQAIRKAQLEERITTREEALALLEQLAGGG